MKIIPIRHLVKTNPIQTQYEPNFTEAQNERKLLYQKGLQEFSPAEAGKKQTQSNPICEKARKERNYSSNKGLRKPAPPGE